jgi:hypothetical protein
MHDHMTKRRAAAIVVSGLVLTGALNAGRNSGFREALSQWDVGAAASNWTLFGSPQAAENSFAATGWTDYETIARVNVAGIAAPEYSMVTAAGSPVDLRDGYSETVSETIEVKAKVPKIGGSHRDYKTGKAIFSIDGSTVDLQLNPVPNTYQENPKTPPLFVSNLPDRMSTIKKADVYVMNTYLSQTNSTLSHQVYPVLLTEAAAGNVCATQMETGLKLVAGENLTDQAKAHNTNFDPATQITISGELDIAKAIKTFLAARNLQPIDATIAAINNAGQAAAAKANVQPYVVSLSNPSNKNDTSIKGISSKFNCPPETNK